MPKSPVKSDNWEIGVAKASSWLRSQPGDIKILVEQNRNLGDTLHLVPIIRHYRLTYPNAHIAFLTAHSYAGAHILNPDINKIFTIPSLNPQLRIKLRKHMMTLSGIKVVAPSIFPYGAIWKELAWSYSNIADQYLFNAGIKNLKPKGGRRLRVWLDPEDIEWADRFIKKHNLEGKKLCSLEYISYSHAPAWGPHKFRKFVETISRYNVRCISFAGPKERPIKGSVSAAGCTWRQTVALMEKIDVHVGIGSGITMLAAAAQNQPKICEILVSSSITMKGCGYAPSISISNDNPEVVANHIWHKVLQ